MNRRDLLALGAGAAALGPASVLATMAATISANGRRVATMQEAADIGGHIELSPGVLTSTGNAPIGAAHFRKRVEVQGLGTVIRNQSIENKGTFIVDADASFSGLDISGATGDGIGAAFRHQSGNLRITRTRIHACQNGLLGPAHFVDGNLIVDGCDVFDNATGTGQTHGLYVGIIRSFTCLHSRFRNTYVGHHVKSRAMRTMIGHCQIGTDFLGNESYNVDVPQGGEVRIEDCVMRQGPRTDNPVMLNFGGEKDPYARHALAIARVVFESKAGGVGVRIHANADVVATLEDCGFVGVDVPVDGDCVMKNCTHDGRRLRDGKHVRGAR